MEGLVEGRIVHFVLDSKVDETTIGEVVCRPATIVNAWGGKLEDGMISLQVFLDGNNDREFLSDEMLLDNSLWSVNPSKLGFDILTGLWMTSVKYSETKEVGTWHWFERS